MTKIKYKSYVDMSEMDYDYICTVAAEKPENMNIEEINDFLNEVYEQDIDHVDDYMKDFDDYDMNEIMKGIV